jgi:hypothetical protein
VPIDQSLAQILKKPTPEALWQLRAELLNTGLARDANCLIVLDEFYAFLNKLVSTSTAREYSHFASILDMGAVAGVAVQNLIEAEGSDKWLNRLLIGGLSEVAMVLAARQYVKAWEEEMKANYDSAAWYLWQEYWFLSSDLQPELQGDKRRQLIEALLAPIGDPDVKGIVKAAVIVHLLQLLLLARVQMDI